MALHFAVSSTSTPAKAPQAPAVTSTPPQIPTARGWVDPLVQEIAELKVDENSPWKTIGAVETRFIKNVFP